MGSRFPIRRACAALALAAAVLTAALLSCVSLRERPRAVRSPSVPSVAARPPARKVARRLETLLAASPAEVEVTIVPREETGRAALEAFVVSVGGRVLARAPGSRRLLRAALPPPAVRRLAARNDVRRIEPFVRPRLLNDVSAGILGVPAAREAHGLTGRGQLVSTSDSGLDTGDPATVLDDFAGRVRAICPATTVCQTADTIGHGTHTAGSIAGDGTRSGGNFKGVAPAATLWVWAFCRSDGQIEFDSYGALLGTAPGEPDAFIHSASWGSPAHAYTAESREIDEWLWAHPDVLAVFAAGNGWRTANNAFLDAEDAITAEAAAKNVLAVGATESYRPERGTTSDNPAQLFAESSRGPLYDGRIKPDLCAPGTAIVSTYSTKAKSGDSILYTYMSGTSMATPLVAGAAALVRQWLMERRGYVARPPSAALMKAVLVGGAHDMSADAAADCGGTAPNGAQGWGRVDLSETLYPSNRMVRLEDRIPFAAGSTYTLRVETVRTAPLDVQLVWTDYPGEASDDETPVLVNDLDLTVTDEATGETWWGNGVAGGDRVNNVEGVRLAAAAPSVYVVTVTGRVVPHDHTQGGAAALYLRGAFPKGLAATFR